MSELHCRICNDRFGLSDALRDDNFWVAKSRRIAQLQQPNRFAGQCMYRSEFEYGSPIHSMPLSVFIDLASAFSDTGVEPFLAYVLGHNVESALGIEPIPADTRFKD